jgi:OmpA-OmpF porin, OOP family
MRKLATVVSAALLATSVAAVANEGVYLGPSISHYKLDNNRSIVDDSENSTVLGGNLGYRFPDSPFGIEVGYGSDIGGESLDVFKVDALYFLSRTNGWAPFFVLGYTDFDMDDNPLPDEDSSQQIGAGFGFSKTWGGHWEVRGDGRFYERVSDGGDATDLAFNLALNYYFTAAAEPVVEPEPAPVVQEQPPATRTITVKLNVLFEYDKAEVRAIYGDELLAVANAMKEHDDIELLLEGHTDSRGTEAYNQDLSLRRVEAVKAKLVQVYGIPGDRIGTVGYGESRPIADNATSEGRALNRRVIGELTFEEAVAE